MQNISRLFLHVLLYLSMIIMLLSIASGFTIGLILLSCKWPGASLAGILLLCFAGYYLIRPFLYSVIFRSKCHCNDQSHAE